MCNKKHTYKSERRTEKEREQERGDVSNVTKEKKKRRKERRIYMYIYTLGKIQTGSMRTEWKLSNTTAWIIPISTEMKSVFVTELIFIIIHVTPVINAFD